jgi:AcrR family transcriptional regulator
MGRPKNFSREQVLEKAMPIFWKRGFSDTSLQELERATGVNKSGLYTEFRDKEDLFVGEERASHQGASWLEQRQDFPQEWSS